MNIKIRFILFYFILFLFFFFGGGFHFQYIQMCVWTEIDSFWGRNQGTMGILWIGDSFLQFLKKAGENIASSILTGVLHNFLSLSITQKIPNHLIFLLVIRHQKPFHSWIQFYFSVWICFNVTTAKM